jgi:general secretion pathway protein I
LKRIEGGEGQAGFTLIEALVALALVLAFAAALGPHLFQARHILIRGDGQIRAQLLLRSLLETPFDRANPEIGTREGEASGMRWRVAVEPAIVDALSAAAPRTDSGKGQQPAWSLFRVKAYVAWGAGQIVTAETLRLGKGE